MALILLVFIISTNLVISGANPQQNIQWAWEKDLVIGIDKGAIFQNGTFKNDQLNNFLSSLSTKISKLKGPEAEALLHKIENDQLALAQLGNKELPISSYTWHYRIICHRSAYYRAQILNTHNHQEQSLIDIVESALIFLENAYQSGLVNSYRKEHLTRKYQLLELLISVLNSQSSTERQLQLLKRCMQVSRMGEFQNNRKLLQQSGVKQDLARMLLFQIEPLELQIEEIHKTSIEVSQLISKRNKLREKYLILISTIQKPGVPAKREEAGITFFEGQQHLYRWSEYGDRQGLEVYDLKAIRPLILAVSSTLQEGVNPLLGKSGDTEWLYTKLKSLKRTLLGGLPLDTYREWWVDADGALLNLPFEALIDEKGQFLVHSNRFRYHNGIEYADQNIKGNLTYLKGDFQFKSLELPHLKQEESFIKSQFGKAKEASSLSGFEKSSWLYAATHQVWQGEEPVLLLNEADSLFRNEFFLINDLPTSVVLNACASMAGAAVSGEGNRSMGQRLLEAGTSHVIASLWAVEDASSAALGMGYLNEVSKGRASDIGLRNAKTNYLDQADDFYAHPFFWAPLLHFGASVTLETRRAYQWYWLGVFPLLLLLRWRVRVSY